MGTRIRLRTLTRIAAVMTISGGGDVNKPMGDGTETDNVSYDQMTMLVYDGGFQQMSNFDIFKITTSACLCPSYSA